MKRLSSILAITVTLSIGAGLAPAAYAQSQQHGQQASAVTAGAAQMSSGEVIKVDKDTAKVTIKHGPLESLKMPAMTMVFKVKDPSMLDRVKPGDKINFVAEKVNGVLTVAELEVTK